MKNILVIIMVFIVTVQLLEGQMSGSITGRVVEMETKNLIEGVQVFIPALHRGTDTNEVGGYLLTNIHPGVYTVNFQRIGYQGLIRTDVVVHPNRTTFLNIELRRAGVTVEGVTVRDEVLFDTENESGTNVVSFSYEEIRRAPGSAGDVSRIMMSLPSVAKVNDQSNNLIVRGGNPFENTFYIDGIEIPNINHFPHQGGSGGPIGMLNVDLINDVSFYTGGFSAIYGDKLSSIMDISFREGNRLEFEGQVELSMVGIGGIIEGPMFSGKGSWLLTARRSYFDYVIDWFDVGSSVAPKYNDLQLKTVYEINPKHKLTLLGIWADDHNAPDKENAVENQMSHYGNQDLYQGTLGINWRALVSNKTFTTTALSYTGLLFEEDWYDIATNNYSIKNRSFEQNWNLRNSTQTQISDNYTLQYGIDFKYIRHSYDNRYGETTNFSGEIIPEFVLGDSLSAIKSGLFINNSIKLFPKLAFNLGLRFDYFDYNENYTLSPRFAAAYTLNNKTTLRGAVGLFHQNLPLLLLSQNRENRNLKDPRAIHGLIGIDRLVGSDTKVTMEIYEKRYDRFPMDKEQPTVFVIDGDMFEYYGSLNDDGEALSRGIELIVQKKLLDRIYGLVSATAFRSKYRGLDNVWKDRGYDNRFAFSIEGGYKPSHLRDFSIRWIYAGGVPYTPLDIEQSRQYNRAVYDVMRINEERFPDYHSLNIRYDRRIFFNKTSLTYYISVWNAYDRKNIAEYYWNSVKQEEETIYQWRMLPVIGVEYAF